LFSTTHLRGLCLTPTQSMAYASPTAQISPSLLKLSLGGRPCRTLGPTVLRGGARGFASGLINVWPEHSEAIDGAPEARDYKQAATLIAQMRVFRGAVRR